MSSAPETARTVAAALSGEMPEITRSLTVQWQDPMASAARGLELSGLDYMEAVANGEIPPAPIAVLMNMNLLEVGEGRDRRLDAH